MPPPLEGIKVLSLSGFFPGSFCSGVLADFGAEVIWVEEPSKDKLSGRRAQLSQGVSRKSSRPEEEARRRVYDCVHRNKKSIILNLKNAPARDIVQQLAQQADVFLEGFRPGVSQRLGVDYNSLVKINPRMIYCSITLYGQDGPYCHFPGHDPCALSLAGIPSLSGEEGEKPRLLGVPAADVLAGLHAVMGIIMALRVREVSGKGQYIDVSLTDSALSLLTLASPLYFRGSRVFRMGRRNPSTYIWETKDGKFICTTNIEAHHWASFCRLIGREDFIPYQHDPQKREEMYNAVREIFLTKTRDEWFRLLTQAETQAAPVYQIGEVFTDPQILHRQMVVELEHPVWGKINQLGIPLKLSQTPGKISSLPPLPGEHTKDILTGLGYTPEQIESLINSGAVG